MLRIARVAQDGWAVLPYLCGIVGNGGFFSTFIVSILGRLLSRCKAGTQAGEVVVGATEVQIFLQFVEDGREVCLMSKRCVFGL